MAKPLSYKKTTTETITAKGILDSESKTLAYIEDKVERTVQIQDLLNKFASNAITLTIKIQSDEDLELDVETDEEIED
ncbi:hypothetical protein [Clostridium sp.]|uniref:hypothetical protein n=1 Tax=Clostridium sp. TaxID=1506 RepID=UPI0032179AB8